MYIYIYICIIWDISNLYIYVLYGPPRVTFIEEGKKKNKKNKTKQNNNKSYLIDGL